MGSAEVTVYSKLAAPGGPARKEDGGGGGADRKAATKPPQGWKGKTKADTAV